MKERPILFKSEMVKAILSGQKTQTRRILNDQPSRTEDGEPYWVVGGYRAWSYSEQKSLLKRGDHLLVCPYGKVGDRLWVREAWRTVAGEDSVPPRDLTTAHRIWYEADAPHQPSSGKLRPSMFMPRWASRITLEITGVRVERLADISEADARAEGVSNFCNIADPVTGEIDREAVDAYEELWESINGAGTWNANPWVWVVTFKRVEKAL